jgi:hypothetical protein
MRERLLQEPAHLSPDGVEATFAAVPAQGVNGGRNPRKSGADMLLGLCVVLLRQGGWQRFFMADGASFEGCFAPGSGCRGGGWCDRSLPFSRASTAPM